MNENRKTQILRKAQNDMVIGENDLKKSGTEQLHPQEKKSK